MNGKDPSTMPLADETGVYGCIPVNSGRGGAPRGMGGGLPPPPTYLGGAPLPPPDTESSVRLTSQDEFEAMVLDMKRSLRAWVDKTEKQIGDNVVQLQREQRAFEEEKARAWQEFVARKQGDYDRIREDKNRADMEAERGTRQIRQEREDARARLQEEREAVERDVQLGRRRFTLEREKFRCEFEAAEKERQLISDHNVATETLVDINVGGVTFESSRQTYTQQPGSLLERLMTGRAQAPRDRDGRIFLDRDSSLFRTIVNFLREPSQPPPSRDAAESDALCQEAEHLGIRFHPYPLVYAVGGHDGSEHLATAEVLDVENQCWRPIRPMQTERQYFGAEVLHARPYLFGGQNLEYTALVETECLDTLRGAWMKGSNLNVPRRNCASTQLDGRIFAIGGYDGERLLSHVEAFDPRMKSWMPLEPMTVPRSAAAATTYEGRVWVLGGTSGSRLRTMERYDPRAGKWEALRSDMVEVRSAARACNCLDRLYALGGTDQNQNVHSSLESFNPEAGASWVFRKSMLRPRMDFGCCVLSDSIMAGGGNHGEAGVLSSTEFYRPELDDWQLGPSMLSPRYGHQLLLVNL